MTTSADPFAVLRTKKYVALLVLAAVIGVVFSFLVYWYLRPDIGPSRGSPPRAT
jgi:hypothetical protein